MSRRTIITITVAALEHTDTDPGTQHKCADTIRTLQHCTAMVTCFPHPGRIRQSSILTFNTARPPHISCLDLVSCNTNVCCTKTNYLPKIKNINPIGYFRRIDISMYRHDFYNFETCQKSIKC